MNWVKTKNILPPNDEFVIFWNPEYKFCPFRVAKSNIVWGSGAGIEWNNSCKYSSYKSAFSIDPIYWHKIGAIPYPISMIQFDTPVLIQYDINYFSIGKCIINKNGIEKFLIIENDEGIEINKKQINGWANLPREPINMLNNNKIVKRYEILDI